MLIPISYLLSFILACFIFTKSKATLRKSKIHIGTILKTWSTKFNPYFIENIFNFIFVLFYCIWCIYQIIHFTSKNGGHFSFMFLILLFSCYYYWQIIIGTNGIIIGYQRILWSDLICWQMIKRKNRDILKLEYKHQDVVKKKEIKIPPHYLNKFFRLLRENCIHKEIIPGESCSK